MWRDGDDTTTTVLLVFNNCGLGNTDSSAYYADIDYAFFIYGGGGLSIYESGSDRGSFGTNAAGDRLKVAVEGGVVKYYRNSTLLYTSTVAPTYPLQVDTSLNTVNAGVYNVVVSDARLTASPVNYVLQDVQGSTRAVMSGTSVIARHDFQPFGEEIAPGIGMRTWGQGFSLSDKIRQRYAMIERDDATGLDHTWWRKYENRSGRWTSPDPYLGSMTITNPQSFNRYAYVQNDPVNFVDPTGLVDCAGEFNQTGACTIGGGGPSPINDFFLRFILGSIFGGGSRGVGFDPGGGGPGGGGPGGGPPGSPQNPATLAPNGLASDHRLSDKECDEYLAKIFGGAGAVVGSTRDPLTVGSNPNALAYAQRYGLPTDRIGERSLGHGPAPYNNPDPRSSDRGGIIHIYGNAQGTASNTALYAPSGGTVGPIFTTGSGNVTRQVSYSTGLNISFVHVIRGGGPARSGSVVLGIIGGPDSGGPNYRHTHIVFSTRGNRVDPRKVFCGQ